MQVPDTGAVFAAFREACAAVSRNDPEAVAAILGTCDAASGAHGHHGQRLLPGACMNAAEARFAIAIIAMEMGHYKCASQAWSDTGLCWSDSGDETPGVPSARRAARALKRCCDVLAGVEQPGREDSLAEAMETLL
jgi:hypothetical protein